MNFMYAVAFPEECVYYLGPQPVLCYATIWKRVGCLEEGLFYPQVAPRAQISIWDSLTLP